MKMPAMRQVARDGAEGGDGEKLFVMTYNVLAQCYIRSSFFPYCKPSVLRWKNRSKQLQEVFASSLPVSPDVICLQEVDQYNEFWVGMMAGLGYNGVFIKKTSRKPDGVAMFWKTDKLQMKSYEEISLDKPNGNESGEATRPAASPHFIGVDLLSRAERGSVGVVAHFQYLETPLEFVVTTTHLFWDPAQEDVKLLQTRRMLLAVDAFTSAMDASTPTIFAGDFNSLPDSKVYQFITGNKHFRSAYARYDHDGEPAFTNVNGATETEVKKQVPSFVGTLDYIFYRSARMQPAALMEIMAFDEATREVALPSSVSPSDHLPILCEFHIQPSAPRSR